MNAMMVGITRRPSEFRRISDSNASVDRDLDGEDAVAQTSTRVSKTIYLVTTSRRPWSPEMQGTRKVMRQKIITTPTPCPTWSLTLAYSDDGASDKDEQEHVHAEPIDDIVDETIRPSPTKMRTRSKSRGQVLPEPIICSDTEDDEPCPR